ncbi:hypothetical protein EC968_000034 [Mortierella alpina]|nr:hypothetical protein EC968_000034 [Mortierella alpina]
MDTANHHTYPSNPASQQSQSSATSSSAAATAPVAANSAGAPKKRTHKGTEKKRRREGGRDGPDGGEKKPQVSSCDACKEAHRKCNGLEPCVSCETASLQCTYNTLSPTKKRAHDAYVLMKKQEHSQRLKSADIIVARMGQLDIAGTNNNFGPILSQVINLPRYEPPPSNFENDKERLLDIGPVEQLLIDCYFKHFNYYIPILNRKSFMELVKNPEQLKTLEAQKLLACVLATGFAFRQELGDPNVINKMEPNYGTGMVRKFHHFNTQDVFNSSIENCQCYLILTGFYSSITNYDAVHNLVALSHSIAAGQGLNRNKGLYYQMPYKGKDHTADTIEIGHRIFWSVVIVCSGYSLSHQSPFITSNDYDIAFPARQISDQCADYQGIMHDDYEGIKDLQHFVPMYEISSRVADITCTATRQRPHTKVDEVREMLTEWRTKTLPPHLRITPTDMDAIRRQSRFSKFYHAISYMFEICLHHTFQLHESHRELGVHGIWSSYCYDAAVGIKNIYNTRPMTRMNSHVILPVAAGAFANIVASKVLGKEESAQKHCDEIKVMLAAIVRASSSVERDRLSQYVGHGYAGVTQNAGGQVESFVIPVPESPPMNELSSPPQTTASSPEESTDITGDTDAFTSDEEEEEDDDANNQDKRMTGNFIVSNGQHVTSQQLYQSQHRPHPSMTRAESNSALYVQSQQNSLQGMEQQRQQHHLQEQQQQQQQQHHHGLQNYVTQGYNEMMPQMASGSSAAVHHNGVSASFAEPSHGEGSLADRSHHQQHSFSVAGNANGHHPNRNNSGMTTAGAAVFSGAAGAVTLDEIDSGLVADYDLAQQYGPRLFMKQQFNDAQLMKLDECRTLLTHNQFTPEQIHQIEIDLQYQLNALADDPTAISSTSLHHHGHPDGFSNVYQHSGQDQHFIQHPHQHPQHPAAYTPLDPSTPISLKGSQLLSGGLEGLGTMPDMSSTITSLGFSTGDFIQDNNMQQTARFYHPPTLTTRTSSSTTTATTKSYSSASDLLSPISATSSNQASQQQSLTSMSSVSSDNAAFNGMMGYQHQQQQQQQQHKTVSSIRGVDAHLTGDANVNMMNMGLTTSTGGLEYGDQGILMYDPSSVVVGGGSGGGGGVSGLDAVVLGGSGIGPGEEDSLMGFMNDPDLMLKSQIFSRVASSSLVTPPAPQSNQASSQQPQQQPQQQQQSQQQQHSQSHSHPQQQHQQQYPISSYH